MSSKKITSRGPSFLPHEDKQLCSSWLEKSECSIRGCEKKFLTHWKEVTDHYNSERESAVKKANERTGRNDEPVIRTLASLKTRWNTIHPIVSKFCGHYQRLLNDNRSGMTAEDVVSKYIYIYIMDMYI